LKHSLLSFPIIKGEKFFQEILDYDFLNQCNSLLAIDIYKAKSFFYIRVRKLIEAM